MFRPPIKAKVKNTEKYAVAAVVLHNYFCMTKNTSDSPTDFIDSETNDREIVPELGGKFLPTMITHWEMSEGPSTKRVQPHDEITGKVILWTQVQFEWRVNHVTSCRPVVAV